jgi:phosphatidylinositol alpha-mannosyltransferase
MTLRIGLVSAYAWPEVTRGGERYLHDLAWYLVRQGHQVDVITGTEGPSRVDEFDGATFRRHHHRLPERLARRGTTTSDTFGLVAFPELARRRYDVVHALAPTGAVAARLTGHRVVFTVMGHPTEDQLGRRPADRQIMSAGVRAANVVTAYSEASARKVTELFGRPCIALNLGIRTGDFPLEARPRSGPPRILFPAYAEDRRKGLDVLVAAMATILDQVPDARLQLLGGGDSEWAFAALEPTVATRARAATDDLGRHVGDVSAFYRSATVSVLPSQHEAFGVVLVESLSSGSPVVCSDDGGMPEIVSSPLVGRVASPAGDAAALATALLETLQLAADPATPQRCADHAARWDWDRSIGPAHERLYGSIVRRKGAGTVQP